MAWDRYRRTGRSDNIKVDFYTGMPTMFSVPKYSKALDQLRVERHVGGHFKHELVAIDTTRHIASFKNADETLVDVGYTFLHVVPPMGPLEIFRGSPISDKAGWVHVNPATLQHANPEFDNIFALGDCSSLPTSKTAAAITSQAPVLTENLYSFIDTGKTGNAEYDGYTSCPVCEQNFSKLRTLIVFTKLLTGYGELMLAEFKYGLEPKETFSGLLDQTKSHR